MKNVQILILAAFFFFMACSGSPIGPSFAGSSGGEGGGSQGSSSSTPSSSSVSTTASSSANSTGASSGSSVGSTSSSSSSGGGKDAGTLASVTIRISAKGWTPSSAVATIASVNEIGLMSGDAVQVWGSTTGKEPSTNLGNNVGTVYLDPVLGITVTPDAKLWEAFPYYALIQIQGEGPSGEIVVSGQ